MKCLRIVNTEDDAEALLCAYALKCPYFSEKHDSCPFVRKVSLGEYLMIEMEIRHGIQLRQKDVRSRKNEGGEKE